MCPNSALWSAPFRGAIGQSMWAKKPLSAQTYFCNSRSTLRSHVHHDLPLHAPLPVSTHANRFPNLFDVWPTLLQFLLRSGFVSERTTLRPLHAIAIPSLCRLSVVCNVGAPTGPRQKISIYVSVVHAHSLAVPCWIFNVCDVVVKQ